MHLCAARTAPAARRSLLQWAARAGQAGVGYMAPRCIAPATLPRSAITRTLSSFTERPAAAATAASSEPVIQEAELDDSTPADLTHAYFPYGDLPAALPLQGFHLCRVGVGGTPRPGNTVADATAAVKSYVRLGGNLIELTRGSSFDAIDAFKELIQENKVNGPVIIAASISSHDIVQFVASEQDRWRAAQQRRTRGIPGAITDAFASELLPAGVAAPRTPEQVLPLLPRLLPAYLTHFLALHELDCVDVLLLEPPLLNMSPDRVPDSSFDWMGGGGVDRSTASQEGMDTFVRAWFRELERAVQQQGSIKSYGISTARITLMHNAEAVNMPPPRPAEATPSAEPAAALPAVPAAPYGSQYYYPLERVLSAATDAARQVSVELSSSSPASPAGDDAPSSSVRAHNLSTIKFPFSLFSAHRLLYSSSSSASSSPSLFDTARAAGLLCLGDVPFDDSEPRYSEWVRFQECDAPLEPRNLLKHYKESMQKITNLEYVYKLLVEESKLTEAELPPRIPDFSWGGLIHAHQNDVYNVVTWESLLHRRIRPSLARSIPRLKSLTGHPKLQDWASRYSRAAPEAAKRFQHAVEHTTHLLNEKLNERFVAVCPRLAAFPTLDEKCMLILLSTPIHALLTDQSAAFGLLAQSLVKAQAARKQEAGADQEAAANASVPTIQSELQRHLLSAAELRATLDMLQSEVAALLPARVMNDELRKKKPTTIS